MEIQTNLTVVCSLVHLVWAWNGETILRDNCVAYLGLSTYFTSWESCTLGYPINRWMGFFRSRLRSYGTCFRSQSYLGINLLWRWAIFWDLWVFPRFFWIYRLVYIDTSSSLVCIRLPLIISRWRYSWSFAGQAFAPWGCRSWLRLNEFQRVGVQSCHLLLLLLIGNSLALLGIIITCFFWISCWFPWLFVGDENFAQILRHQCETPLIWLIDFLVSDAWQYLKSPNEVAKFKIFGGITFVVGLLASLIIFLGAKDSHLVNGFLIDYDGINFKGFTHRLKVWDTQLQHLVLLATTRIAALNLHFLNADFFGKQLKN